MRDLTATIGFDKARRGSKSGFEPGQDLSGVDPL